MIFPVARPNAFCSQAFMLEPGDVLTEPTGKECKLLKDKRHDLSFTVWS
jgi:hypothetical protein